MKLAAEAKLASSSTLSSSSSSSSSLTTSADNTHNTNILPDKLPGEYTLGNYRIVMSNKLGKPFFYNMITKVGHFTVPEEFLIVAKTVEQLNENVSSPLNSNQSGVIDDVIGSSIVLLSDCKDSEHLQIIHEVTLDESISNQHSSQEDIKLLDINGSQPLETSMKLGGKRRNRTVENGSLVKDAGLKEVTQIDNMIEDDDDGIIHTRKVLVHENAEIFSSFPLSSSATKLNDSEVSTSIPNNIDNMDGYHVTGHSQKKRQLYFNDTPDSDFTGMEQSEESVSPPHQVGQKSSPPTSSSSSVTKTEFAMSSLSSLASPIKSSSAAATVSPVYPYISKNQTQYDDDKSVDSEIVYLEPNGNIAEMKHQSKRQKISQNCKSNQNNDMDCSTFDVNFGKEIDLTDSTGIQLQTNHVDETQDSSSIDDVAWNCSGCTYLNKADVFFCAICNTASGRKRRSNRFGPTMNGDIKLMFTQTQTQGSQFLPNNKNDAFSVMSAASNLSNGQSKNKLHRSQSTMSSFQKRK